MSTIQLVVFDIAGTTVKDKGNVAGAFIGAFHDFGFAIPEEEVKKVMGFRKIDAIRVLLEKFYPEHALAGASSEELIGKIHDLFIGKMVAFYQHDTELEPMNSTEAVFAKLREKGIKVALNTGFTRSITDAILERLHWNNGHSVLDGVICSDEVPQGRPAPDMINALIHQLGIASSKNVLKVGDTEVDVQEGRNADCGIVVSVTTGAYTREQLEGYRPDHIINDLADLLPIIESSHS